MRKVTDFFRYTLMTPEEKDKWERVRATGISWYLLRHSLLHALYFFSFWVIANIVISRITEDPFNLRNALIFGAVIGVATGVLGALSRWERNQTRFSLRPPKPRDF